jgi:FecR-like protein
MKKTLIAAFVAFTAVTALTQTASSPAPSSVIDYRFDAVKRSVTLMTANQQLAAAIGQRAQSGDKVETGWFSYALIASEQYRAKFELFSSTQVQLAEGTPGVLLSVERGKIRAMFDKIVGSEPRVVKTPGALLAVRGTKFDVDVDSAGRTTVDVFEGTVEVRSELLREPLLLRPGQQSIYGRRETPTAHPMPEDHRRNDPTHVGEHPGDPHGMGGRGDGSRAPAPGTQPGQGQPGRMPAPTTPPPQPPSGHH